MAEIFSDPRMEERGKSIGGRAGALGKSAKQLDDELQAFKASVEARLAALEAPKVEEPKEETETKAGWGLVATPTTVTLPDETVGEAVSNVPVSVITGGTPPFTASIDPNSPAPLPPGLNLGLDANGNLTVSGTPTAAGSGSFVVDVTDSGA